ncbi:hypothetical protein M0804_009651 [Polistes exclamans]|nr:hypothetical protein M0804_009651 [Polistes exclamans]
MSLTLRKVVVVTGDNRLEYSATYYNPGGEHCDGCGPNNLSSQSEQSIGGIEPSKWRLAQPSFRLFLTVTVVYSPNTIIGLIRIESRRSITSLGSYVLPTIWNRNLSENPFIGEIDKTTISAKRRAVALSSYGTGFSGEASKTII